MTLYYIQKRFRYNNIYIQYTYIYIYIQRSHLFKHHPPLASDRLSEAKQSVVLPRAHAMDLRGTARAQGVLTLGADVRGLAEGTEGR